MGNTMMPASSNLDGTPMGSSAGAVSGGDQKANPFVRPPMYSPRLAADQKTTFNPMSTSQHYLARFGTAKHF